MGMSKKQLEQSLSNSPNKDFIMDQVEAQLATGNGPPYSFWFNNFKVKSYNATSGKTWESTNRRKAAERAYNKAGVNTIKRATVKRFIHIVRVIQPGGQLMDSKTENMRVGLKSIVDELTKRGYIYDDADKWIEIEYSQRRMTKGVQNQWGVSVSVYELNNNNKPIDQHGKVIDLEDWRFNETGGDDA